MKPDEKPAGRGAPEKNPYDPNFLPLCDAVRDVARHLAGNGQWLLFETGQETPVTLLRCFETVGDGLPDQLNDADTIAIHQFSANQAPS